MQEIDGNIVELTEEQFEKLPAEEKKTLHKMDRMPVIDCEICDGTGRIRIKKGKLRGLYRPCKCTQEKTKC